MSERHHHQWPKFLVFAAGTHPPTSRITGQKTGTGRRGRLCSVAACATAQHRRAMASFMASFMAMD